MFQTVLDGEIVDDTSEFFAPAPTDQLDTLMSNYKARRRQVEEVAALFEGDVAGVVTYFIEGNWTKRNTRYSSLSAERIFDLDGAVAALNADFWSRALALTDVLEHMPQKRRSEWWEQIREMNTPEFTEDNVRSTLTDFLLKRSGYFAERVDGIFRALSREHVTNRPEGFFKRMIVDGVLDQWGTADSERAGYINDLRLIIAKFMGRTDEPSWYDTRQLLMVARRQPGVQLMADGGTMKIRCYLKGTVHIEVHPEMAFRLNQVLAQHNPHAIPSGFRTAPRKPSKQFDTIQRPLPFKVLGVLASLRRMVGERRLPTDKEPITTNPYARRFDYGGGHDAESEAAMVLQAIGAIPCKSPNGALAWFEFDYDPDKVIDEIVVSGCIPDRKSHQLYPTPEPIARKLVELAEIGDEDSVLEPSAGLGNLARFLPRDRTQCVEIAMLHCKVLESQGFRVAEADFLEWCQTAKHVDRVVMNPPFSEGRARAHLDAAAELVTPGGRLVAVLPASQREKWDRPGWSVSWSAPIADAFPGTSAVVTLLCACRDEPN